MSTTEDLDKRLTRLETLHLWGGVIIIGLGILAYINLKK